MVHADHRGGQNEIGLKEADRIINGSNNSSGLSMTSMLEPVRGVPLQVRRRIISASDRVTSRGC
jgi:hypothetical protein